MSDDHAELLDENAIYRRTQAGQRELISPTGQLQPLERRFLAVVTGHTPLGVLADLTGNDPELGAAVISLQARAFIALEGAEGSVSGFVPHDTPQAETRAP